MGSFPDNPAAIEAGWLERQLWGAGILSPDSHISALEWERIGTGQVGDTVRLKLTYSDDGAGPPTLAAKFASSDPTSRATAAAFGLYRKEVGFYRDLAAHVAMRLPKVFVAEIAPDGADFLLVFEDLGPARGGNQLDGCSFEDACAAVRQAAALHAPSRAIAGLGRLDWLQTPPGTREMLAGLYPKAQAVFRERYADVLEPEFMAICEGLAQATDRWFARDGGAGEVIHGDFRLDNLLFDIRGGAELIAVVDLQTVALGNGLTDIGYFLGCGIGNELRRQHEDALLDLYCEEMARHGVRLTRQTLWDDYRLGALHGVATAVFSAANVVRTERGDANFLSMARGACGLALDHDSLGRLMSGV